MYQNLVGTFTPPPAWTLVSRVSKTTPDAFLTSTRTSKSSKNALESTLNSISAVSILESPSLSASTVEFRLNVAGEVILAASTSITA